MGECQKLADEICAAAVGAQAPAGPLAIAGASFQASIVTGLSNMLADRAKQEVEAWFEDLIRDRLCGLKFPGTQQRWFPNTCKLLDDKLGLGQQVASSLVAEMMKEDIKGLIAAVGAYVSAKLAAKPAVAAAFAAAPAIAIFAHEIYKGRSPLALIKEAANHPWLRSACVSRTDKKEITVPCAVVAGGITINYFGEVAKLPVSQVDDIKKVMIKVFAEGALRCDVIKALSGGETCDPTQEARVPDVVLKLLGFNVITDTATFDKVFVVLEDMIQIEAYINSLDTGTPATEAQVAQQIEKLLGQAKDLLQDIDALFWTTTPKNVALVDKLFDIAILFARHEYRSGTIAMLELLTTYDTKLPTWGARFLPLALDLAEAKDSSEVQAAITRAAAPIGSWKLKRQKPLLSITGLVGAAAGYEAPIGDNEGGKTLPGGFAAGLMAPIGLELSTPLKETWSFGVLISVLDLGQLTWARVLGEDETATEAGANVTPDVSFAKVFSPGGYLVLGIGRSPFTVGVGASYAPDLRDYTYDVSGMEVTQPTSVWRLGGFVAIDVTLIPLF